MQQRLLDQVRTDGVACGHGGHIEEQGMLLGLLVRRGGTLGGQLQGGVDIGGPLEGHAKGGQHCLRSQRLQLFLGDVGLGGLHKLQILEASEGMEKVILALPEDLAKVLIVHGAEIRLRTGLAHQLVDLRRGEVGLAPQIQLGADLELLAARLQGARDGVHVPGVDLLHRHLASVLLQVLPILAERLAQTLELLGALVGAAELKGVLGGLVVNLLQADVRLQHVEDHLVGVPQKAEVHVQVSVLALLPGVMSLDGLEKNHLRGLHLLQVLNVDR
mmetsp:Transcript_142749/g.456169  ORF Transcript_142749/g.456169 Transcript_142749/m.456169 type:complete len:274 (-) Transcript_142749:430-1251(-)